MRSDSLLFPSTGLALRTLVDRKGEVVSAEITELSQPPGEETPLFKKRTGSVAEAEGILRAAELKWRKMKRPRRPELLAFIAVAVAATIPVSSSFNLDTVTPEVYSGDPQDFFGYKVLQFTSNSSKGIIVTSPLRQNGSGGIFRQDQDQTSTWFDPNETSLPNTTVVKHLGLSIAADSTGSHFTVCSPSVAHECYENSYLNSVCYNVTERLQQVSEFTPGFQDCTKKTVDLVFLFDGSNSMKAREFEKNKDFIIDIMNNLQGTSIKFAAAQFATEYRKVFDFNDYVAGRAKEKLKKEKHMRLLTNTHRALTMLLDDILESPTSGASSDATKVLVLITDGDPSDTDRNSTVKKYDKKNIIRFVIGVKNVSLDKFQDIASKPTEQTAFKIENYDGLTGVLENFQKKIFTMEGSTEARAGNMTDEMSQTGFSAIFHKDQLILGSVGSNSWQGSIQQLRQQKETQIKDPQMKMDSYMGYSVAAGERHDVSVYFTGAPRFEHTGLVVLFRHDGQNWRATQRITGEQIGSYFGGEICSLDVNSDGETDFLLVGAPLFYQPQERKEGRIYIYTLTDEMLLKAELNVTAPSLGRFGATISGLADLNGDGLRDVAVGAPLEDDNQGAVYIYLGDRQQAIRSTYSQRIAGATVNAGRRFFGQAIDGNIDLGDDELPDVVVGSEGAAVVLRSKPVFNVAAHLSFLPEEISTDQLDCLSAEGTLHMLNLTVCFKMLEATKSKDGDANAGLNISYTLDIDRMRQKNRGFFERGEKKSRNLTNVYEQIEEKTCFNYTVYMPKCVVDTLSPVRIRLNFAQVDGDSENAVLNVDSVRNAAVEANFERHCTTNDECIAELDVDFSFLTPTLVVTENSYFNLSVTLDNRGDDSYNTSLSMRYPPGLSFSRMTLAKATRSTLHSCHDPRGALNETRCGVSLPVYRSGSSATFNTSFLIMSTDEWSDTISMTVEGKSDNTNATVTQTKTISVQFEVKMALTVKEDTVTYMNFTSEDAAPKKMWIKFRVDNIGFTDFPANISLFFPTKLEHNFEMSNYEVSVQQNKTRCNISNKLKSDLCPPENACGVALCDTFNLEKTSGVDFTLSGDVHFRDLKQLAANIAFLKRYTGDGGEVKFFSFLQVEYDTRRYVLDPFKPQNKEKWKRANSWKENNPTMKWSEVRVEFIVPPDQLLIILTGAGLGFLLLIIITVIMFKLGCFKRKTMDDYQKQEEEEEGEAAAAAAVAAALMAPTQALQSPEEKPLLHAADANGKSPLHVDAERTLV